MIEIPAQLEPLASFTREIMGALQWFLGGIFGLYVILLIVRVWTYIKIMRKLKKIENKLEKLPKRRR